MIGSRGVRHQWIEALRAALRRRAPPRRRPRANPVCSARGAGGRAPETAWRPGQADPGIQRASAGPVGGM